MYNVICQINLLIYQCVIKHSPTLDIATCQSYDEDDEIHDDYVIGDEDEYGEVKRICLNEDEDDGDYNKMQRTIYIFINYIFAHSYGSVLGISCLHDLIHRVYLVMRHFSV